MRLIDASALQEEYKRWHDGKRLLLIDVAPTVDAVPVEWIDKHLEWLDNCDNDFAQLAKVSIKAMVELWKKDRI